MIVRKLFLILCNRGIRIIYTHYIFYPLTFLLNQINEFSILSFFYSPNQTHTRIEKWEDRRDLIFSHLCLVGMMEKSRNGKLICLVEMKNGRMEIKLV